MNTEPPCCSQTAGILGKARRGEEGDGEEGKKSQEKRREGQLYISLGSPEAEQQISKLHRRTFQSECIQVVSCRFVYASFQPINMRGQSLCCGS